MCQEPCLALVEVEREKIPSRSSWRESISKWLQCSEGAVAAEIYKGCQESRNT